MKPLLPPRLIFSQGKAPAWKPTPAKLKRPDKVFEGDVLLPNNPCNGKNLEEIAAKIGVVHTELLVLHPYRDGNGRTGRLLATVMAYQAGLLGIDLGFIKRRGREFEACIAAMQAGSSGNDASMTAIMLRGLRRALSSLG